jgi:Methyltransferase domain
VSDPGAARAVSFAGDPRSAFTLAAKFTGTVLAGFATVCARDGVPASAGVPARAGGRALLRSSAGDGFDREFVAARIAEIRALLDQARRNPPDLGEGSELGQVGTIDGYRQWSAAYDDPGNLLIQVEQPVVREILDRLPPGTALDAACGTGRHAEYLAGLGHRVIGVDGSPEMLARARARVRGADFLPGDLHRLPIRDQAVDLVVCALALTHVPALPPVLACFEPRWPPTDSAGGPQVRQWCAAAADAVYTAGPTAIIWHFEHIAADPAR